jgi:hypothetical protein
MGRSFDSCLRNDGRHPTPRGELGTRRRDALADLWCDLLDEGPQRVGIGLRDEDERAARRALIVSIDFSEIAFT